MREKVSVLTVLLIVIGFVCGCEHPKPIDLQNKWAHEERMARIKTEAEQVKAEAELRKGEAELVKAQQGKMNDKEKTEFAEMVADKVLERIKQQQD